ncbi:MAG: hypothetical protein IJI45_07365 [Anaerolineaceae bacterium]|nr:hypothetical protein [Anaerolineaceae bacterium]
MKQKIQIDREFMNLSIPLSRDNQERLERSLMRDGCLKPIIIWRGVVIDGHKRFKFCNYEEIEYEIQEMDFTSREEAVIWVCRERLATLDKYSPMFRYLVGKWYICKKNLNRELRRKDDGTLQNPDYAKKKRNSVWDTCSRLSEEVGVHRTTISKDGAIAEAMDRIADIEPSLFEAILRGDVRFKHDEILELSRMDEKKLSDIRRRKLGKKDVKMRRRNRNDVKKENFGSGAMAEETQIKTGIKEMPAFDPDIELKGLMLTVPTWINLIARTEKKTDMNLATKTAKEQLATNLLRLQEQINHTLEVLV